MQDPKILIVGAGPAGLAAAAACAIRGVDPIVLEGGRALAERNHSDEDLLVSGVGGAGLYSDGKFPFYPSATRVWTLSPVHLVDEAFNWLINQMDLAGWTGPDISQGGSAEHTRAVTGRLREKSYPSFYLSPQQRHSLIENLSLPLGSRLQTRKWAKQLSTIDGQQLFETIDDSGIVGYLRPKTAVLAIGRFGQLTLLTSPANEQPIFARIELGVRLEQPVDQFFLRSHTNLDPKLLIDIGDDLEMRTFCCCRDGEVITATLKGIRSVSGRADCDPTGRSNVGLLVRITRPGQIPEWTARLKRVINSGASLTAPAEDLMPGNRNSPLVVDVLGKTLTDAIWRGVEILQADAGLSISNSLIHGPAIEGVGAYPLLREDLQMRDSSTWVAGDGTGLFRGITAAMVSGYIAGANACRSLSEEARS